MIMIMIMIIMMMMKYDRAPVRNSGFSLADKTVC